jgi:hypothetical protein
MTTPGVMRDRLTHLCFIGDSDDDVTGHMEKAFVAMYEADGIFTKILKAQREGLIPAKTTNSEAIANAKEANVISEFEYEKLVVAEKLRWEAINVDSFAPGVLEGKSINTNNAAA